MEFLIREASSRDLPHLLDHRRAMFVDIGFRDAAVLDSVDKISEEYFQTALCAGRYRAWLAEDRNGSVVAGGGMVIADWPGFPGERHARRAWILNMYTQPVARRQGLARRLLETMVEWCRQEGFGSVSLHASEFGRPLYESLGFAPTNEMRLTLR